MRAMPDVIFVIAAAILFIICPAYSTSYVEPGQSIQSAIDASDPGETIEVESGTYLEQVVIDKPLKLIGLDTGGSGSVIDAGDAECAIIIKADDVLLEGFTARSSSGWGGNAGIEVTSNHSVFRNNIASNNENDGMILRWSNDNLVEANVASGNRNEGISLINSRNNTLVANEASNNRYGFKLLQSSWNTLDGNLAGGNRFEGIYLDSSAHNTLLNNYAYNNWGGISLANSIYNQIYRNEILGNDRGIYLSYQNNSQSIKSKNGKSSKGVRISYAASNKESSNGRGLSKNTIYLNNLSNTKNAYDDGINQWDNGSLGNNYSDFNELTEGCDSSGGICNSWYRVLGGPSVDRYPQAVLVVVKPTGITSRGQNNSELHLNRSRWQPESQVDLGFRSPSDASISLVVGGISVDEMHTGQNASVGRVTFKAPSSEGLYSIRMSDRNGTELASIPLEVALPRISAMPKEAVTCDDILVTFSGAPGLDDDWVGMYRPGSADESYLDRQFLGGAGNGTLRFGAPSTAGSCEFRLFDGLSGQLLSSSNIVLLKGTSGVRVTAEPKAARPGDLIKIHFWGAPTTGAAVINMYEMTRPDKFYIASQSLGAGGCGTVSFVVPSPGTYDFRMFEDNVYRKLMGQSNTVNVR